jgi:hypothetical protein
MAYTEEYEVDVRVFEPYFTMECRHATVTKKDGNEVGRTFYRHVTNPGDPTSKADLTAKGRAADYSETVEKIAAALWTEKVKEDYKKYEEDQMKEMMGG